MSKKKRPEWATALGIGFNLLVALCALGIIAGANFLLEGMVVYGASGLIPLALGLIGLSAVGIFLAWGAAQYFLTRDYASSTRSTDQ